jgi:hypothetical protein
MLPSNILQRPSTGPSWADFPGLASLRLDRADFHALMRQGFVSQERRGQGTRYKLRFRNGGQQRVRCIRDREQAESVQAELDILRQDRDARRRLAALRRSVTPLLRRARQSLEPYIEKQGFRFHGHQPRRRRTIST